MGHNSDNRRREQDDFWDISELMPRRLRRDTVRSPNATEAVEIEVAAPQSGEGQQKSEPNDGGESREEFKLHRASKITPGTTEHAAGANNSVWQEPVDDYVPAHPLIHRVRVYDIPSEYNYYEQFLSHAERICGLRGKPCRPVPFFSYVPVYSQLTRSQLDWYLWWREQVWQGEYPEVDYSYVMLYANEIINTGGHSSPAWGQRQLCELWRAYHGVYSRFSRFMAEWICDFSLIWHLPAPVMPPELMASSSLREFYTVGWGKQDEERKGATCDMLITCCSNYDYRSSKFARGDVGKIYKKHIPAAIESAFSSFCDDRGMLTVLTTMNDCNRTRSAYTGALCTYKCRKKIVIDYCSFSHTHELRMVVTDAVKYAENKLRAYLGVKSRLCARQLRPEIKRGIDEYFARELPQRKQPEQRPQIQEYERLYDVPTTGLSLEAAERIERESWRTTERLLEAFEDDPVAARPTDIADNATDTILTENIAETVDRAVMAWPCGVANDDISVGAAHDDISAGVAHDDISAGVAHNGTAHDGNNDGGNAESVAVSHGGLTDALGEYMEFVRLVERRDTAGQREFARRRGEMVDLIFDKINEISVDYFGDVILFESDDGLEVVEEYRGELYYD